VTLIANEVVSPGATVLDPGVTKRFHAYTEGIPLLINRIENSATTVRATPIRFKLNPPEHEH
jgi:hypothetical protein